MVEAARHAARRSLKEKECEVIVADQLPGGKFVAHPQLLAKVSESNEQESSEQERSNKSKPQQPDPRKPSTPFKPHCAGWSGEHAVAESPAASTTVAGYW